MRRDSQTNPLWIGLAVTAVAVGALLVTNFALPRSAASGHDSATPPPETIPLDEAAPPVDSPAVDVPSTPGESPAADEPTSEQVADSGPQGSAGMVVGIDPETGRIGKPTPAQPAALASRAFDHSSEGLTVVHRPDGSRMVDLQDRFQEYAIVRIAPDGTKQQTCVDGPDVEAALKGIARSAGGTADAPASEAPDAAPSSAPVREER